MTSGEIAILNFPKERSPFNNLVRGKKDIRLFFALWPDEGVRDEIADRLANFVLSNGRQVPQYNWHMTLHFIGNTTFGAKICLDRQARKVRAKPFELNIDQTGFFKKPRVFWLGFSEVPEGLFDLQGNLGEEISDCDYQPETRPYSPHITVTRRVYEKPLLLPIAPIKWQVDEFVLIESVSAAEGVRYRVIERYNLK